MEINKLLFLLERESFHIPSLRQSHETRLELLIKFMGQDVKWGKKIRAFNVRFDLPRLRSKAISLAAVLTQMLADTSAIVGAAAF